jgi:spermidine synthase
MSRLASYLSLFLAGLAALSWQVLWHLDLSLALGVSAQGAALTVGTVMVGMMAGALWAGKHWNGEAMGNPWRTYAGLELCIGGLAWLPRLAMPGLEKLDAFVYATYPSAAAGVSVLSLALTLGPATFAMGASIPVFGLIGRRSGCRLSGLYAANTLGAAVGSLLVALLLLPSLGRFGAAVLVSATNGSVALLALGLSRRAAGEEAKETVVAEPSVARVPLRVGLLLCLVTGMVTFGLEVSWFRLLRAAWLSTSDSFAIMLFSFLISLGLGAALSKRLTRVRETLALLLCLAAAAIWLGTAVIERLDAWGDAGGDYGPRLVMRVLAALLGMGPAVLLIGLSLPALLDDRKEPRQWAWLYATNTLGAVIGSTVVAWGWMEWLGPVRSAWLLGLLLLGFALPWVSTWKRRGAALGICGFCGLITWAADSGIGTRRVQGPTAFVRRDHQIIAHQNGPDQTTSVVRTREGYTLLFIDGYAASGEVGGSTGYMDAMGRLPMLMHPRPAEALVICFGTGQTGRAVLDENPAHLDIVDVNPAVFDLSVHFGSNRGVLRDPRTHARTMDGRAWLRRESRRYDVITLEPMPPFFAGSNSLYSVEFYELIRQRLREEGCVAQWFPIHLLTPSDARAVAAAFVQVFPQSILWFDPRSHDSAGVKQQGILIGRKGAPALGDWPGYDRDEGSPRPYPVEATKAGVLLSAAELAEYVAGIEPVTDDNQRLSFGQDGLHQANLRGRSVAAENMAVLGGYRRSEKADPAP